MLHVESLEAGECAGRTIQGMRQVQEERHDEGWRFKNSVLRLSQAHVRMDDHWLHGQSIFDFGLKACNDKPDLCMRCGSSRFFEDKGTPKPCSLPRLISARSQSLGGCPPDLPSLKTPIRLRLGGGSDFVCFTAHHAVQLKVSHNLSKTRVDDASVPIASPECYTAFCSPHPY